MRAIPTCLPGVAIPDAAVRGDGRGYFYESHDRRAVAEARGVHDQLRQPQGKLVRVVSGDVFDVAVDIRRRSPAFGAGFGTRLPAENKRRPWVPPGLALGFLVLGDGAEVLCRATAFHAPGHEAGIGRDGPGAGIDWPLEGTPLLPAKDRRAPLPGAREVYA